ncbi:MAG: hypothetical protein Q7T82_17110 [Armatimonadota bacterium]|nr:hypothetical protein [Armatimonadota bacterium]
MLKCFQFGGTLVRREFGAVTVMASTVEEAKKLLALGEWTEIGANGGETDFEWDDENPEVV